MGKVLVRCKNCTMFCTGKISVIRESVIRENRLRRGFCKDRVWLGTRTKRFSDFAENVHISVFWAETTENEVRIFIKKFRREIWRQIQNSKFELLN